MTVGEALRETARRLEAIGGSGRLDAALLLEHVTGAPRTAFVTDADRALSDDEEVRFAAAVARRAAGEPIAYIVGTAGFYGHALGVDPRVLVPRPETEHLVEAVVTALRSRGAAGARIADVGTGSGAIAVALAAALPDAWIFGTDVSPDALDVARRNAARCNVFQQCTFLRGDLAVPLGRFAPFAAVVANLPYVPTAEIPARPDPVAFEPPLALDGGRDGLAAYRRLLAQLPPLLAGDAVLAFEAAPGTVEPLAKLVAAAFPAGATSIGRDYGGRARYVTCEAAAGG